MALWFFLAFAFLLPSSSIAKLTVDDFSNPPTSCEPFVIKWEGGKSPYTLSVLNADDSSSIEVLGSSQITSYAWHVDVNAGTSIKIQVTDDSGTSASSNSLVVQSGDSNCLWSLPSSQTPTLSLTKTSTASWSAVSQTHSSTSRSSASTTPFSSSGPSSSSDPTPSPSQTLTPSSTESQSAVLSSQSAGNGTSLGSTSADNAAQAVGTQRTSSSVAIAVIALFAGLAVVGAGAAVVGRVRAARARAARARTAAASATW
ncbi:hypothetical protein FB45DRAFT_1059264 [Roridomyces roridus]|uniref:Mid2 domain-containing protein n=1 Tax=Roridomyces roridus TaxID=1738132 RepID=A0AAD7BR47_9AGAR|nr:hypothetical protein FB45DRAFT_1059264 [Roridomyces roridus]